MAAIIYLEQESNELGEVLDGEFKAGGTHAGKTEVPEGAEDIAKCLLAEAMLNCSYSVIKAMTVCGYLW